jgi:aryl-alcohol dehydrogenase-like predicted oxidoreductase|tara:strand:- start:2265 stop:2486 length:222 start_codon:yes stop_codon:yes gene_type:complete
VDVLVSVGEKHGVEAAQIALAWLLTRPAVSSLVVGGSNEQQFINNFRALDVMLDQDDLDRLDRVSQPPLIYPY